MDRQGLDLRPHDRYFLPGGLRAELARDFGPLLQTQDLPSALSDATCIAAVGDVVSMTLKELGITPRLFVCDFKTQRGDDSADYHRALGAWGDRAARVGNPAASVTRDAWDAVRDAYAFDGTTRIEVDGEEDLLGIPVMAEAPDGAKVLYGAPGRGVVVVTVDAALRARIVDLVGRMGS